MIVCVGGCYVFVGFFGLVRDEGFLYRLVLIVLLFITYVLYMICLVSAGGGFLCFCIQTRFFVERSSGKVTKYRLMGLLIRKIKNINITFIKQ